MKTETTQNNEITNKKEICPKCSKLLKLYDADDPEQYYADCENCGWFGWVNK